MIRNLAVFATAALLEIAGCFAFWDWLRRGSSPLVAAIGIASLVGFAMTLTRADAAFAGARLRRRPRHLYRRLPPVALGPAEQQRPTSADT